MTKLKLYQRSRDYLWTDEHIAKQLLLHQLDPTTDKASRRQPARQRACQWIKQLADGRRLIDLGCGPGRYAEELSRLGFEVMGVDISRSAIEYAISSAQQLKLPIHYDRLDYLTDPIPGTYDTAICIYCDFGALTPSEQRIFLDRVSQLLVPGGRLIFDVFSHTGTVPEVPEAGWTEQADTGFWADGPHRLWHEAKYYPEARALGNRYRLHHLGGTKEFITWDTFYDDASITRLLHERGFTVEIIRSDLLTPEEAARPVLFISAKKRENTPV